VTVFDEARGGAVAREAETGDSHGWPPRERHASGRQGRGESRVVAGSASGTPDPALRRMCRIHAPSNANFKRRHVDGDRLLGSRTFR
jgi:hypothetical protein